MLNSLYWQRWRGYFRKITPKPTRSTQHPLLISSLRFMLRILSTEQTKIPPHEHHNQPWLMNHGFIVVIAMQQIDVHQMEIWKKSELVHFRYAISPPRPMMINENTRRSWQYPQLSVLSCSLKHIVFLFVSLVWHEIACTDKSGVTGCVFGRLMLLRIPHKHVALSFWFFFSLKS